MSETKAQQLYKRVANRDFNVGGVPVGDIVGVVSDLVRRRPNVKLWAQAKRQEKRRLKALGLSGSDLRQGLRQWQFNNPKPQGSEPFNPTQLGVSNQMNGNAQSNIQNPANAPIGGLVGTAQPVKSGFNFMNPIFLLIAIPVILSFVFPKQFKRLRKSFNF